MAEENPPHRGTSPSRYLATRLSSLKPPLTRPPNPIRLLRSINRTQWAFFAVAFAAWTWDAFDFFTVSLTVSNLAETFGKSNTEITWGITLVLMFRSIGSMVFGIAADRYGRKWPFIINNVLFMTIELVRVTSLPGWIAKDKLRQADPTAPTTRGFTQTYSQFLTCRALFGVAMGGLYGNAAATAIEDLPPAARGLMSGLLQQGYAFGYLLAAAFTRGLVDTTPHGWRPLFWFGACPPLLIILFRLMLPETETYTQAAAIRARNENASKTFLAEGRAALKTHWLLLVYLVLFMAGFNFMSHGSQDLYPTMLRSQFGFSQDQVTITQVIANLGAMLGGTVVGFSSQVFGRRLSIIVMCVVGGALLFPYTATSSTAIIAPAFFEQFCVQGAWGVVPIHLMELSPGAFRTFVVGTSYQLGNLASSASSTIESELGETFPLPGGDGVERKFEYGKVICIFMGCVYGFVVLLTVLGPEHLGKRFDVVEGDVAEGVASGSGTVAEKDSERGAREEGVVVGRA
ncbi:hypothetical protein OQA88_10881 [Cercophora sp. LCS_1]